MKTLPLAEVKIHLSSLLKEVTAGTEIGITFGRKRETIAVIVPIVEYKRVKARRLGTLQGKVELVFKNFEVTDEEMLRL